MPTPLGNCYVAYLLLVVLISGKLIYISAISCKDDEFTCGTQDKCVLKRFMCDKEDDCPDKSDEAHCDYTRPCLAGTEYRCADSRCILNSWKCDNYPDCKDWSDEHMCNQTCAPGEFSCNNGVCLPGKYKCDRDPDCMQGEDEKDCVYSSSCAPNQFRCKNKHCIDTSLVCDSDDDCGDKSDEENCGKTCKKGSFTCNSGECVAGNLKCNGKKDCLDGSDEDNFCPTAVTKSCSPSRFTCSSGECIHGNFRCDGEKDCEDNSDEQSCASITCPVNSDKCDNDKCISTFKFCDGKDDCGDNSDEKDATCLTTTPPVKPPEITCKTTEYRCKNKRKCVSSESVCDKKTDCPDGDDETACFVNECLNQNGNCSELCIDTNTSFYCSCKHGYKLQNDSRTCEDVDECEVFGKCSQKCINTIGMYKCSCQQGYMVAPDGKRCMVLGQEPSLLLAAGMDIRQFPTHSTGVSRVVGKTSKRTVAVGLHYKRNKMIWSDTLTRKILRDSIKTSGKNPEGIVHSTVARSLSIDWVNEKIYWISELSTGNQIEVANLDGSYRKVLISTKEGHSIVVDPERGYLYWTDPDIPSISRAYMDGSNVESIITNNVIFPTGLTIDFTNKRLIWLDSKRHSIESSDLDGNNRRTIITSDINHPESIVVFEDTVYWSETMNKRVFSANKFTGDSKLALDGNETISSYEPRGLFIDHPITQPNVSNPCSNGGCSHLCLLTPTGYTCTCPEDAKPLLPDGKTCKIKNEQSSAPTTEAATPSVTTVVTDDVKHTGRSSGSKDLNTTLIGACVGGVLLLLVVLVFIIYVLYHKKKSSRKMEIHYSSELGVKIVSNESNRPVQATKNINREDYVKFANQNFKEEIEDDEEDEDDITNVDESQPVFKQRRHDEIGGQIV